MKLKCALTLVFTVFSFVFSSGAYSQDKIASETESTKEPTAAEREYSKSEILSTRNAPLNLLYLGIVDSREGGFGCGFRGHQLTEVGRGFRFSPERLEGVTEFFRGEDIAIDIESLKGEPIVSYGEGYSLTIPNLVESGYNAVGIDVDDGYRNKSSPLVKDYPENLKYGDATNYSCELAVNRPLSYLVPVSCAVSIAAIGRKSYSTA